MPREFKHQPPRKPKEPREVPERGQPQEAPRGQDEVQEHQEHGVEPEQAPTPEPRAPQAAERPAMPKATKTRGTPKVPKPARTPLPPKEPPAPEPSEEEHGIEAAHAPLEVAPFAGLDDTLRGELPTFEMFFKTFGFKRILGRVWGMLVLAGQPMSSKEIAKELSISAGATSAAVNELAEWGAIVSEFDSSRRCHLHRPVGNTLSIVATVLRRREQVAFSQFKQGAERALAHVRERYGDKDPRVLTLRSILSSCEIADALMQLIFNAVGSALGDPQSLLSRTVSRALRMGLAAPARLLATGLDPNATEAEERQLEDQGEEEDVA